MNVSYISICLFKMDSGWCFSRHIFSDEYLRFIWSNSPAVPQVSFLLVSFIPFSKSWIKRKRQRPLIRLTNTERSFPSWSLQNSVLKFPRVSSLIRQSFGVTYMSELIFMSCWGFETKSLLQQSQKKYTDAMCPHWHEQRAEMASCDKSVCRMNVCLFSNIRNFAFPLKKRNVIIQHWYKQSLCIAAGIPSYLRKNLPTANVWSFAFLDRRTWGYVGFSGSREEEGFILRI